MLEFTIMLAIVVLVSPTLTAFAAKKMLPHLNFGSRMLLSMPQALIFSIASILISRSGWLSKWEYLTWFSIVFGQAIGFLLVNSIKDYRENASRTGA